MICSNKFMRSKYGTALRDFLATKTTLLEIIDFGELPVFQDAATFPVIIITRNKPASSQRFLYVPIKRLDFISLSQEVASVSMQLDERALGDNSWTLTTGREQSILDKMRLVGIPLGEYVDRKIYRGVVTGCNEAFVIDRGTYNRLIAQDHRSAELIKPFLMGDDIRKYRINLRDRFLIFARRGVNIENYPEIYQHLLRLKDRLMPKPKDWHGAEWSGRKPGTYQWYEIQDTIDYYEEFAKPKIIFPDIAKESRFAFDKDGYYPADTTFIIPTSDLYLLGLLNSRLCWFALKLICPVLGDPNKGGRLRLKTQYTSQLPIRRISFSDAADKARHDRLVALVEEMLALRREHAAAEQALDETRRDLARRIAAVDRAIDALVYELYELTQAEIAIVEGVPAFQPSNLPISHPSNKIGGHHD
jgi:hypothetical protein